MLVLALDSALDACSAAVVETDGVKALAAESRFMSRGHAEALLPLVRDVMRAAATEFRDLDRIAVTVGPGGFTGLRVGLAAARGLALAAGRPAHGVTTLAALAAPVFQDGDGPVAAVLDVRRDEICTQVFRAPGEPLTGPALLPLAEAANRLPAGIRLVGSGAPALAALDPRFAPVPGTVPDIVWVARLGARTALTPPRAFYVRPPDAKPQDAARTRLP